MNPVIQDLLEALQDDEMTDVVLIGNDDVEIPASRFVLAARSNVLRRMLYGNFREAKSTQIRFHDYDSITLEAIVEYCYRNEISKFRLYIHRTASSARKLVQLYKAADYLALLGLAKLLEQMVHNLTTRFPPLACAVYDESDAGTKISKDALEMIQSRPYVTLPPDSDTDGGISCLSDHKLVSIYKDLNVQAGELFLFRMLEEWVQSNSSLLNDDKEQEGQEENRNTSNDVSIHSRHDRGATKTTIKEQFLKTVELCASYLVLENIEPHDLLTIVSPSGFCTPESITKAITQQALRASQTKVWSLSSRGPDIERILVEGAGSKDANGIYYRVDGLANGELYSKREISCGQQFVYTLSISLKKSLDEVECRIFCSKLLTHRAIGRLVHKDRKKENKRTTIGNLSSGEDSGFHPILQVIGMSDEGNGITTIGNPIGRQVSSRHWVKLSDGDHFIYATMAQVRTSTRGKEPVQNTLIKIMEYEQCITQDEEFVGVGGGGVEHGHLYLRLKKLSVISQDPGHKFGNPVYYYDACDDESEEGEDNKSHSSSSISSMDDGRQATLVVNPHPSTSIVHRSSLDSLMRSQAERRPFVSETQALHELYCCTYYVHDKPIDSKVPSTEWQIDSHGVAPGPQCRWIPQSHKASRDSGSGDRNAPSSTLQQSDGNRSTVASFNSFAASVLPLPIQSKYSLFPFNTTTSAPSS